MAKNLGYKRTGYGILWIIFHEDKDYFETIFASLYNDCHHKTSMGLAEEWALENGYQPGEDLVDFFEFKVNDSQGGSLKDFVCDRTRPFIQFGLHI